MNRPITFNVMAPLNVGDPSDPHGKLSEQAWVDFAAQLKAVKKLGAYGVSTDVWWGTIERNEDTFTWNYPDKLGDYIIDRARLKWFPILSFHDCVPSWVFAKLGRLTASGSPESVMYVSEQGNINNKFVAGWATPLALGLYRKVMSEFQSHYAPRANDIGEINISLGPDGEIRYPSYDDHDRGTQCPNRGALQCYSDLARQSFFDFAIARYCDAIGVKQAWGSTRGAKIEPPADPESFFAQGEHRATQFGRDFFDWYHSSLLNHARMILNAAIGMFQSSEAAFKGIDIGAKVPGIHWRIGRSSTDNTVILSDRLAELAAGLICTSGDDWDEDVDGRGYRPLISLFRELSRGGDIPLVVHFTCMEMPNGEGDNQSRSLAQALARWVGTEARRQNVRIKGENALAWNIPLKLSWDNMRRNLALPLPGAVGTYEGLTFLRMGDILASDVARTELFQLVTDVFCNRRRRDAR